MEQSVVEMPKAEYFEQALRRELGEARAQDVIRKAGERYRSLYAEREQYANRTLRKHLEERLLPGIALYQTLLAEQEPQERAAQLFEQGWAEWGKVRRQSMEQLGRLPMFYTILRLIIKTVMRLNYPPEGWETEWVEISGKEVSLNISKCFYLDVLNEYGAPELIVPYCKMDDWIYDGACQSSSGTGRARWGEAMRAAIFGSSG